MNKNVSKARQAQKPNSYPLKASGGGSISDVLRHLEIYTTDFNRMRKAVEEGVNKLSKAR